MAKAKKVCKQKQFWTRLQQIIQSIPGSLPTKQTVMILSGVMIITMAKAKKVSDPDSRAQHIITIAWPHQERIYFLQLVRTELFTHTFLIFNF